MYKKLFTTVGIIVMTSTSVFAADGLKKLGNEIKETNKNAVESIKQKNKELLNSKANENKAKIEQYKNAQKQEHDKYQSEISAKKAEIEKLKKANMPEAQKEARKQVLQNQINELSKKDQAARESYNKKIDALKI